MKAASQSHRTLSNRICGKFETHQTQWIWAKIQKGQK